MMSADLTDAILRLRTQVIHRLCQRLGYKADLEVIATYLTNQTDEQVFHTIESANRSAFEKLYYRLAFWDR
jgi:hypothetical protein